MDTSTEKIVPKMQVRNLYKVFGSSPKAALDLLEQGAGKDEILEKTKQSVGLVDVNFDVYDGEILVIMGLSGSGKSTLVRCLNRLIEPSRGTVTIDDCDITSFGTEELRNLRRKKFGMVFQHFALFPHLTVQENAGFGLVVQGEAKDAQAQKAREALKQVGLEGWEASYPSQLSGGMQQRVGLARALAVGSDILLMDEAFSALDPLIRRDMQHELVELQDRFKKTIIFITHDLDEALEIGDRIILMKDGGIVQIGTPEEILTKPANEYVARFVENVDMSKVLTASAVMVRAQTVAYPKDGLRTMLHKMRDVGISSICVVNRDKTLRGLVTATACSDALKSGAKTIDEILIRDIPTTTSDEAITNLIARMAEADLPLPVVSEDGKLHGIVVRGSLLAGLAAGGCEPAVSLADQIEGTVQ
ncbi:MAG: glycine betaine/L-proline ABC transporter ATP-binding protein [Thermodesulfobacteriota bacterium]|nr:glycine betaine/L-proline ABC transporter ATP-binding protein [Thermodesulfobacteriota bacterium]